MAVSLVVSLFSISAPGFSSLSCSVSVLSVLSLAAWAAPAAAQTAAGPLTLEETEALVRRIDYEGMPEDEAARIGPAGAARLVEMLADPAERAHHGRILLALATSGQPGAFEAIEAWSLRLPAEGELDRAAFRAWQALPFALGRLARHDSRAVAELVGRFDGATPAWSFRHFRGDDLRRLEQSATVTALGETRLPEAARSLDALARRPHSPALAEHLRAVRAEMSAMPPAGGLR